VSEPFDALRLCDNCKRVISFDSDVGWLYCPHCGVGKPGTENEYPVGQRLSAVEERLIADSEKSLEILENIRVRQFTLLLNVQRVQQSQEYMRQQMDARTKADSSWPTLGGVFVFGVFVFGVLAGVEAVRLLQCP
jgi:hypothetical protein